MPPLFIIDILLLSYSQSVIIRKNERHTEVRDESGVL